ncbi:hypothetical protein Hdeb2414_s0003g00115221 [Helianthus debilis subsp. tardiflorus]
MNTGATVNYGDTVIYGGDHFQVLVFLLIINCFRDSFGHDLNPVRLKHFMFMKCRCTMGCRKTIKLNEEPNTIKIHASALCNVVNFKQRIRSRFVE